jgi:hypothetical protein
MIEMFYDIDDADMVTAVGGGWERFAVENGVPALSVVGTPLWQHIEGLTTRQVYRELLERVRAGDALEFPFRCDSAQERRWCSMRMVPLGDGRVRFETSVDRESPMPASGSDREENLHLGLVVMCSWCKATKVDGTWVPIEEAVRALGLLLITRDAQIISHGICPPCLASFGIDADDVSVAS